MRLACISAYNQEKTIGEIVEKSLHFVSNVFI